MTNSKEYREKKLSNRVLSLLWTARLNVVLTICTGLYVTGCQSVIMKDVQVISDTQSGQVQALAAENEKLKAHLEPFRPKAKLYFMPYVKPQDDCKDDCPLEV